MEYPQFGLTGRTALVTGAARGLGRAISLALAHAGADMALGLRDAQADSGLAAEIGKMGRKALPLQMDMGKMEQISSAVDIIIQANRLQGGPRKITTITEVMNMEQDMIIMQDVFRYKQTGIDQNGRAFGQFEATGVRPSFVNRLEASGIKLPSNLFQERVLLRD